MIVGEWSERTFLADLASAFDQACDVTIRAALLIGKTDQEVEEINYALRIAIDAWHRGISQAFIPKGETIQ